MSSQRVTNPSDHRDQMNIARELQLARTAISATRQRSRGRGGRGGRARGDSCGLTPPFETHAAASNGDRATRGRGTSTSLGTFGGLGGPSALRSGARGAGLSTSIWAPSAVPDYGTSQMLGRGKYKYSFTLCTLLTE
jgi:hypothetical protein